MEVFSFSMDDGHIMANLRGQRFLVDTGSPVSLGRNAEVEVLGRVFPLIKQLLDLNVDGLSELVGTPIAGLLGVNILNAFDVDIYPETGQLVFSAEPLPLDGDSFAIDLCGGIPVLSINFGGEETRVFFDTGARLSYLEPRRVQQFPFRRKGTDFYPGYGHFTANIYDVPLRIGASTIQIETAALPEIELLHYLLKMAGAVGIVGTAVLNSFQVRLSARRRRIGFQARPAAGSSGLPAAGR